MVVVFRGSRCPGTKCPVTSRDYGGRTVGVRTGTTSTGSWDAAAAADLPGPWADDRGRRGGMILATRHRVDAVACIQIDDMLSADQRRRPSPDICPPDSCLAGASNVEGGRRGAVAPGAAGEKSQNDLVRIIFRLMNTRVSMAKFTE